MASGAPEIRCHLSGNMPQINTNEQSHLRLVASLCMLQGVDEVTLVNEPVEICSTKTTNNDNTNNFDLLVAFQGLDSAAVRHPLLEATVTKDIGPDLCVVLQLISVSNDNQQNILAFGGVSVDTQGLALGGEVRGTVLFYQCVNASEFTSYMLRKVLDSEAERMVRDGSLTRESMHVKLHVTASHRKTTTAVVNAARKSGDSNRGSGRNKSRGNNPINNNTAVSRSLLNSWDRVGRNSVCIIVEVLDGLTVEQTNTMPQPYDISVCLVDHQGRMISQCLSDAVNCAPSIGAVRLPRLWYPFPANTNPDECWCHHIFTIDDVISTSAKDSNIQVRVRQLDGSIDNQTVAEFTSLPLPLRDWRGFNVEALHTARIFECNNQDGLEFRITAQLFSNQIPASPAFASIVNCQGMTSPFPPGDAAQAVTLALSHDELILSSFDEVEPFTNALLDGAFALIRVYPENSNTCLLAFGFVMRIIAASYLVKNKTNANLEKTVKKWLNLHFEIPNMGVKLLRLIASAVDTKGFTVGLGSGTLNGRNEENDFAPESDEEDNNNDDEEDNQHLWPLLIATPSSKCARDIISLTWVPLVKLAFRSHQCSNSNGPSSGIAQSTSVRVLIVGVCKLLHSVAGWAAHTIVSTPMSENGTITTNIAKEVTQQQHAVLNIVLEHQTDVFSILGPLEGFFHGFLGTDISNKGKDQEMDQETRSASFAIHASVLPISAIFEALKGLQRALCVPAVQQAFASNSSRGNSSRNHIVSFVLTLTSVVSRLLRNTKEQHANALAQALSCLTDVICLTKNNQNSQHQSIWGKEIDTEHQSEQQSEQQHGQQNKQQTDSLRQSLIDVLCSIPTRRPIKNANIKIAASMLICAASEIFGTTSWTLLRNQCMQVDRSGGGFMYVISMLGSETAKKYANQQNNASLSNVGRGCVDLLQVMLSSSEEASMSQRAASSLQRTAIKLAPLVQEILRTSVNSKTKHIAVIETLPAATAALLLRHARDATDATISGSGTSLLMSYEMLWVESLVTLLGDVDAFVNDTASECLSARLNNIVRIVEETSATSPSNLSSLRNVLDTLPRRVASRLHRLCTSDVIGEQGIATSNVWWFKPWRVYHHVCGCLKEVVRVEMLASAMDRVAQVCLLYAQLWDSQPDVECQGKYSRCRSNVAVIIVRIVFIGSFLFYCLLFNHSFPTNPNKITNCF